MSPCKSISMLMYKIIKHLGKFTNVASCRKPPSSDVPGSNLVLPSLPNTCSYFSLVNQAELVTKNP